MDHEEATRQMMVERYLLGELSADAQEVFEAHFFDCEQCALDLRLEAAFLDHSKVVLTAPAQESHVANAEQRRTAWQTWFKPALVLPVIAILAGLAAYESLVELPKFRHVAAQAATPQILPAISLINAATRGGEKAAAVVGQDQPFMVFVDIPAQSRFDSYTAEMHDPAGREVWSLPVSAATAKDTVQIRVPGQQQSGTYSLVVFGNQNDGQKSELGRFPFELQIAK